MLALSIAPINLLVWSFAGGLFFWHVFLLFDEKKTEKQKFLAEGIEEYGGIANKWRFNAGHIWIGANKLDANQKKRKIVQDNRRESHLSGIFSLKWGFLYAVFCFW